MIKLSDTAPFAHGNHREVYRHPERDDRCLKLMIEDWRDCDRWKRANVLAKMIRPKAYFNENLGELDFSTKLGRRLGSVAWDFVARAHGFVDSDLGPVLEVDLIRDHDHKISLTLKEHVWRHGFPPKYKEALDVFWQQLDEYWVFVEARPDNLAVRTKADGTCQILAIDGYSYGRFIPIGKWFRREQKRILRKRRKFMDRCLKDILDRRDSGEEIESQGILRSVE